MLSGSFGSARGSARAFSLLLIISSALGAVPVSHAADVFKGRESYANYCEICHGGEGQGRMPGVPNFARSEGLLSSDLSLLEVVRQGKGSMPAYGGILSDRQLLDVIAYLRTLQR